MSLKEYRPGTTFSGIVGRTIGESSPAWPAPNRARPGMPNVVMIVLDDTGFGQIGCYGSPIRTPSMDNLAAHGLLYNNMHTTALCSPSRACILTGRNHHSNGMACITEASTGFPGANGYMPFENGMLSEILVERGYNTYALGKWHLCPAEQTSAAGPYSRWPLGRGFERYYGFLGGDTHQYYPDLVYDNHQVEPPRTPEEGYHLTEDLADRACQFVADGKQLAPEKPFFLYFATGAMHAPHHVPKQWADRYRGAFDAGWEAYRESVLARQLELGVMPAGTKLSRPDPDVQEWTWLSAEERRLYARMMEVFAGFLEHTDHQIGRLVSFLEEIGELENTLLLLVSDNGASAEGGPTGSVNENRFFNNVPDSLDDNLAGIDDLGGPKYFNHYPWGWTVAGNTPFRRWKRETYRGGVSDPFILHWPRGFRSRGEVRRQYGHVIDVVPTVLEALELDPPTHIRGIAQSPLEGVSLAYSFDTPDAPSQHRTQYFEMFGHRSLYHDGWRAVCPLPGPSFAEANAAFGEIELTEEKLRELDAHGWELYCVDEDFSETNDLAKRERDRLIEMIATWYVEAGKYNVLPLDSRGTQRFHDERPQLTPDRPQHDYFPGTSNVPENAAVRVLNRPHSITAFVDIPEGGAEGVLLCHGSASGGYTFYVQNGKLHYVHNYVGAKEFHVQSRDDVPTGNVELRYEFEPTARADLAHGIGTPGRAMLYIDGRLTGEGSISVSIPNTIGIAKGLACGRDAGSTVTRRYAGPFEFTGTIRRVTVDVSGDLIADEQAQMRAVMARQ